MDQKRPEDIDVSENVNMSEKLICSFEKILSGSELIRLK